MTGERTRGPRRGSRRVEGWVYEVINPILDALPIEIGFLDRGDVTWRFLWRKLEFLCPIKNYLVPQGIHILRDFERAHEDVPDHLHGHDRLLESLAKRAAEAHDSLVSRPSFEERVWESVKEFSAQENSHVLAINVEPWGAFQRDQFPALVSEHIVNSVREIAAHHTDSRFWATFGDRFLEFRTGERFDRLDEARRALADYDRNLQVWLEDKRFELCEQYDIPAAPLSIWANQTL